MNTPALELRRVSTRYGVTPVLVDIDLTVAHGETVALLGPSGSGKTTLLYTVAGFVEPTSGEVRIAGSVVASSTTSIPPDRRNVGVVFQNYALWPHLDALDTVAYPLRRRGLGVAAARRDAARLLDRMSIGELAHRRPAELSGGQQQRVGLARALAREAALYLFDEPTAHLDAALRAAVQEEIAERRSMLGAAALYASHDAAEALAVADRIALVRAGRVVQQGTPAEIYEQPVDLWAARLSGPASVIEADLQRDGGMLVIAMDGVAATVPAPSGHHAGAGVILVRPDWVTLGGNLPGSVSHVWYRGPFTDYRLRTPGGHVDVRTPGPPRAAAGEAVGWTLHRAWPLTGGTHTDTVAGSRAGNAQ